MPKIESVRYQKCNPYKRRRNYLREHYNQLDRKQQDMNLGVTYGRIVNNAQLMGLSRPIKKKATIRMDSLT